MHVLKVEQVQIHLKLGSQGLYNLEIHALFSDGQYTSYTLLADFVSRTFKDGLESPLQQSCDAPVKLQVTQVKASNQKDMNGPITVVDNNLGTDMVC